ncbi:ERF family protein [Blastococcus sp. SYSU D00813]
MTTIYEALAEVMHDVQAVKKGDRNAAQGFNFRGIDAVLNAVGPALRKHKVVVSPRVDSIDYSTVEVGTKRTLMGHVRVVCTYTFHGPEGDSLPAQAAGEAMDSGDKATAKAMSVAYRTALLQALALPTDEPDPDATAYERAPARPAAPPADELIAQAQSAANGDELTRIARMAVSGHLTDDELAAVREVVTARRAELTTPTQAGAAA